MDIADEAFLCNNSDCGMRMSCARFYDPARNEHAKLTCPEVKMFDEKVDDCFVLRKTLEGTPDNHRMWQHKAKNFRRRRGKSTPWSF